MSSSHQHQDNQVKMTNVAIVKLKRAGKTFEVAAFRNKVVSYRSGAEKNLDEVLQVFQVFQNVSRGLVANSTDLEQLFGTSDVEACCKLILAQGEMQVSDKERHAEYEQKFKDIATLVAAKCINTQTGWPFTVQTIETAMRDTIHFAVNPIRPAKPQALEVIERLKEHLPIARARIHLKITAPRDETLTSQAVLLVAGQGSEIVSSTETTMELLADPSKFKEIEKLARKFEGTVSILDFGSHADEEKDLDQMKPPADDSGEKKKKVVPSVNRTTDASGLAKLQCLSCNVVLADRNEQRAHYKTDFHTFNVKLKATGLPKVTQAEFENMSTEDQKAVLFDWKQ